MTAKITELAESGALDGSEMMELVQGGASVRATLGAIGWSLLAADNPLWEDTVSLANNAYGPDLLSFSLATLSTVLIEWGPYMNGLGDVTIGLRDDGTQTSWWFDAYNPSNGLDAFPDSSASKVRGVTTNFHSPGMARALIKGLPAGSYTVRAYKIGATSLTLAGAAGMRMAWATTMMPTE